MDRSQYSESYLEEYCGYELLAASIAFIAINTAAFFLRFIARRYQSSGFGWHDGLIVAAYIFNLGLCADAIVALRWGVGYHQPRLFYYDNWKLPHLYKNTYYAALILYYFAATMPKLSILALYLKIFTARPIRIACYILIGILLGYVIAGCFVIGFQCPELLESKPGELPQAQVAGCLDIKAFYAYFSIPNIVTDAAIMTLPLPTIGKLHRALHVRIGLAATFMIASGGMIVAIIRFIFFYKHQWTGREAFSDASYSTVKLAIITLLECNVYFVCACLLCSRPVLSKFVQSRVWERIVSWSVSLSRRGSSASSSPKKFAVKKGMDQEDSETGDGSNSRPHISTLAQVSRFDPEFGDIVSGPQEEYREVTGKPLEGLFLDLSKE